MLARPSRMMEGYKRHTSTTSTPEQISDNYDTYPSEVGFNYPNFDEFGEFGNVIKSERKRDKKPPIKSYVPASISREAPHSDRPLLANTDIPSPTSQPTYDLQDSYGKPKALVRQASITWPQKEYLAKGPRGKSELSSAIPSTPSILKSPQEIGTTVKQIAPLDTAESSLGPAKESVTSHNIKANLKQDKNMNYQTTFDLSPTLFYQQTFAALPQALSQMMEDNNNLSIEPRSLGQIMEDDSNPSVEPKAEKQIMEDDKRPGTMELVSHTIDETLPPQKLQLVFDFPCARSAVYDLNFIFKFCRRMGVPK